MKFSDLIKNVALKAEIVIENLEKFKDLTGKQKKDRLDKAIKEYIENNLEFVGMNFIIKFIIKKFLIENIPSITQAIFDLIKVKIEGVTK